jgi:hypothetical protein
MKLNGKIGMAMTFAILLMFMVGMVATEDKPAKQPPASQNQTPQTPVVKESIVIDWPAGVKWVSDFVSSRDKGRTELFYPEGQSKTNWSEMVTTEEAYGKLPGDLMGVARTILMGTKQGCPDAAMEIIEKKLTGPGDPTIIFVITCPKFTSGQPAEIQLWKMFAGKTGLYSVQYTYRGEKLPDDKRIQGMTILVRSKLVMAEEEPKE